MWQLQCIVAHVCGNHGALQGADEMLHCEAGMDLAEVWIQHTLSSSVAAFAVTPPLTLFLDLAAVPFFVSSCRCWTKYLSTAMEISRLTT